MLNKELIIKKNSALIQVHAKALSAVQRKIINSLVYMIQKTGKQENYKIAISKIKELCNIVSVGNDEVKDNFKELADIKLEFNYLNKDKNEVWEYMSLLSHVKIIPNEGEVIFELPSALRDRLINPRLYAPIDVILIAGLKSSYSVVMYEFLRDYLTSPVIPLLTIEQFRELMGVHENEYKIFPNLKNRVIDKAVNEINEKSDIKCWYELSSERGRKYSHIQFFVTNKENQLFLEPLWSETTKEESEKAVEHSTTKILDEILKSLPEDKKTQPVLKLIEEYMSNGPKYIVSNIKYSLKNSKENFLAYLRQAFSQDYAKHPREVEENTLKKVSIKQKKAENENANKKLNEEIVRRLDKLPRKEYVRLWQEAESELLKLHPDNPFFKRESVVIAKMVELYLSGHDVKMYSNNDID